MKKALVIFLSFLYLTMSAGFTRDIHVCKEMLLKSYNLVGTEHHDKDAPCPKCSAKEKGLKERKKGCCQYETKIVKLDDVVKKKPHFDFAVKFFGFAIPNEMLGAVFDFSNADNCLKNLSYFPSRLPVRGNPLYILHCTYRI